MKIAILITCYNRVDKTKKCLEQCFKSVLSIKNYIHDFYLLDDDSPDKTGEIIKRLYPEINVSYGNGNFYWSKGTRKVWDIASKKNDYDYYIWLNDDVILRQNAFSIAYQDLSENPQSILVGTFKAKNKSKEIITYGGRNKKFELVTPNGKPQKCIFINGNFVIVPRVVFKKIGLINKFFTHNYGDTDYGLRALKNGFKIFISSSVLGICDKNKIETWKDPKASFSSRIKSFVLSKNFRILEVVYFQYCHFGILKLIKHLFGVFITIISPKTYSRLVKIK